MTDGTPVSRRQLALAPLGLALASGVADGGVPATERPARGLRWNALSAADRLDLQDLFARYAWSLDCNDEAAWLDNFLPDALVIGVSAGQVYRGTEAIRGWFRYLLELRAKDNEDWLHDAYHHRMAGDRRSCLVYSCATQFNGNPAERRLGVRSMGYFVSECVRRDGTWLFRRHSVNRWDRDRPPWNKPLPWAEIA